VKEQGVQQRPHTYVAERGDVYIVMLVAAVFFVWLGRVELLAPDEVRHTEIGREMLVNRSFLLPQFRGEPYYDKPAAYYWFVAASLGLFGVNEIAARMPAVIAALLTIVAATRFAARAYSISVARLVVIGLATTPAFVVLGRYGILDMPLTAALTIAFTSLGLWRIERRPRPPYAFYIFVAVAVLIKGPVAAVQAAIAIAALLAWSVRDPRTSLDKTMAALAPARGALLAAAVALPWYIAAAIADPDYISAFLLHHNLERFFAIGPGASHAEPWWFYLAVAPVLLLPWTPWVAAGLARLRGHGTASDADIFCAIWAASVSIVYLLAQSKIATYLLPAVVPFVCLAAAALDQRFGAVGPSLTRTSLATRRWAIAFAALVTTAAAAASVYVLAEHPDLSTRVWFALPALMMLPAAINLPRNAAPQRASAMLATVTLTLLMAAYGLAGDVVGQFKGMRTLASVIETELPEATAMWSFRSPPHSATFYTAKLAPRLDTREQLIAVLTADSPAGVVIRRRHLSYFGPDLPSGVFERWSSRGGTVLLSNVAPEPSAVGSNLTP
jgi:4-amino-4-deoxy-L-arabinose transferase-like glycosyltransferase